MSNFGRLRPGVNYVSPPPKYVKPLPDPTKIPLIEYAVVEYGNGIQIRVRTEGHSNLRIERNMRTLLGPNNERLGGNRVIRRFHSKNPQDWEVHQS